MKKILYSILLTLFALFPTSIFAAGDISVSPTSLTIEKGSSKTFTITAYNTIGDVSIETKDNSIASISTNQWSTGMVEEKQNKTGTITVTANEVGTTEIVLKTDAATFDEEEIIKTLTVKITVAAPKSSDANLASITIDNKSITDFNKNTTTYTLSNTDSSTITIDAKTVDSKAKISGAGTKKLSYGLNKFDIVVTAENGTKKTYTIKITRNDLRSKNNSLETLTINNKVIKLNENTTSYELKVDNKTENLDIKAKAKDSKASIKINKPETLSVGENIVTITVTAENGTAKSYKIKVIKESKIANITPNEDTTIEEDNNDQSNVIIEEEPDNNINDNIDNNDIIVPENKDSKSNKGIIIIIIIILILIALIIIYLKKKEQDKKTSKNKKRK